MSIQIEKFRPVSKNTLVGFVDVQMTNIRLVIRDIAIHCFGDRVSGRWWVSLPAKPMFDAEGVPIINARTGKPDYFAFLRFDTRRAHDSFERQVLAALRSTHPEVFADAGATP
jgi:hypothetical protein